MEQKSPGVYLDSSGIVALFVQLKLDKMEGTESTNLDASAIVYTKYSTDSSNISLMDSAYQFNYNSQINVNSGIPVFKPYNYTLEYSSSSDDSTFYQVTNDMGNWSFDTNSGTIIFEDDPSLNNSIIDLSNGDLRHFTFVKYVGLQGIENLIYHKNEKIGIGIQNPRYKLDISGSVNISKDLEINDDLYVDTTLCVDSSDKRIGINVFDPITDLHVVGNTTISGTLDIGSGVGPGMCPIGTIIMWVNNEGPDSQYGTWLLCDGSGVLANDYPDLSNVLSSSSGIVYLPDLSFSSGYTKGGPIDNETDISFGGDDSTGDITLYESNLPPHTHILSGHSHDLNNAVHSHGLSSLTDITQVQLFTRIIVINILTM